MEMPVPASALEKAAVEVAPTGGTPPVATRLHAAETVGAPIAP